MLTPLKTFVLAGLLGCATGCASRVVVVDSNADVVRIGKGVSGEAYIFRAGEWVKVEKLKFPEGWFAGPGPK